MPVHAEKSRIAVPAQKQATPSPKELRLSLLRLTLHKMQALTSLLILLVYLFYTITTGVTAAEILGLRNPCGSSHPDEHSSSGSESITHLRRTPPLIPTDNALKPQSILYPTNTASVLVATIQISSTTNNPNPTPLSTSTTAQTPLSDLYLTLLQLQAFTPSLTQFDRDQCHKNKHCLLCRDPDTVLTCYKYNCQCQRGHPAEHYMAASKESCYDSELCISCPPKSMPFTFGRMAVCLTIFKHRPIKGDGNPLTNWTEDGVKGLPVEKVVMSKGNRLGRGPPLLLSMANLGIVTALYLLMV